MLQQVRKRSPAFRQGTGQRVDFAQPAAMPHTDFFTDGAFMRMKDVFSEQDHLYVGRSFDLVK